MISYAPALPRERSSGGKTGYEVGQLDCFLHSAWIAAVAKNMIKMAWNAQSTSKHIYI